MFCFTVVCNITFYSILFLKIYKCSKCIFTICCYFYTDKIYGLTLHCFNMLNKVVMNNNCWEVGYILMPDHCPGLRHGSRWIAKGPCGLGHCTRRRYTVKWNDGICKYQKLYTIKKHMHTLWGPSNPISFCGSSESVERVGVSYYPITVHVWGMALDGQQKVPVVLVPVQEESTL